MAIRKPRKTKAATTGPASAETMWALWHMMLAACQAILKDAATEGAKRPTSEQLNVVRMFLKDQGVTTDVEHKEDIRANLSRLTDQSFPFKL
jgi:hypothetical protein